MTTIAIIGCGNIGHELAVHIEKRKAGVIVAIVDPSEKNAHSLKASLKRSTPVISSINEAISLADLIIEAAHPSVVPEIVDDPGLDKPGKSLLIMSAGGLINGENTRKLDRLRYCRVKIPSGAVAGLDAIRAVKDTITSLTLATTKPPEGLEGAPYIKDHNINLGAITKKTIIFEGCLQEAVDGFPQNINVAASLYLVSRFRGLKIRIIADPEAKNNTHKLECLSASGKITTTTENIPSDNPKTSALAIDSAKAALDELLK